VQFTTTERICTVQQHARRSAHFPLNTNTQTVKVSYRQPQSVLLLNFGHTKLSCTPIYTTEAEHAACIVAFLFLLDTLVPTYIL